MQASWHGIRSARSKFRGAKLRCHTISESADDAGWVKQKRVKSKLCQAAKHCSMNLVWKEIQPTTSMAQWSRGAAKGCFKASGIERHRSPFGARQIQYPPDPVFLFTYETVQPTWRSSSLLGIAFQSCLGTPVRALHLRQMFENSWAGQSGCQVYAIESSFVCVDCSVKSLKLTLLWGRASWTVCLRAGGIWTECKLTPGIRGDLSQKSERQEEHLPSKDAAGSAQL